MPTASNSHETKREFPGEMEVAKQHVQVTVRKTQNTSSSLGLSHYGHPVKPTSKPLKRGECLDFGHYQCSAEKGPEKGKFSLSSSMLETGHKRINIQDAHAK